MKLVKEHINFERGIDPKKAMGIGIITWDKLEEGDILTNTKEIYKYFVNKTFSFQKPHWMNADKSIKPGFHFIIAELHREKNYLELEFIFTSLSLKHAVMAKPEVEHLKKISGAYALNGPISEWDSHFRIIQPQEIKELT